MMNPQVATLSGKPASRWWSLDPRVAAHLRAPGGSLANLRAGALAPVHRSVNARNTDPKAFADTEWADTCSDPLAD
jgi:hypothetical protein